MGPSGAVSARFGRREELRPGRTRAGERTAARVLHDAVRGVTPIGALCTGLDDLIEGLIAKAPVAPRRAEEPQAMFGVIKNGRW